MADKPTEVIIINETVWESWQKDIVSFGSLIICIAVGVYLDSSALQWIAGFMFILMLLTRALAQTKRLTIPQARKRLDELEAQP